MRPRSHSNPAWNNGRVHAALVLCGLFCNVSGSLGSSSSSSFPARLDSTASTWWVNHNSSEESDGDTTNSDDVDSSSDFEDVWTTPSSATPQPQPQPQQNGAGTKATGLSQVASDQQQKHHRRIVDEAHHVTAEYNEHQNGNASSSQTTTETMPQSQPLQTLEKLQQMLDETDYMTAEPAHKRRDDAGAVHKIDFDTMSPQQRQLSQNAQSEQPEKLWTSKDRQKYKKQQQRLRRTQHTEGSSTQPKSETIATHRQRKQAGAAHLHMPSHTSNQAYSGQFPHTQLHQRYPQQVERSIQTTRPSASTVSEDDEYSDDTDDGLGYSLPDLPVYNSDAEEEGETSSDEMHPMQQKQQLQQPPPAMPLENRAIPSSMYPPAHYGRGPSPYDPNPPQALQMTHEQYLLWYQDRQRYLAHLAEVERDFYANTPQSLHHPPQHQSQHYHHSQHSTRTNSRQQHARQQYQQQQQQQQPLTRYNIPPPTHYVAPPNRPQQYMPQYTHQQPPSYDHQYQQKQASQRDTHSIPEYEYGYGKSHAPQRFTATSSVTGGKLVQENHTGEQEQRRRAAASAPAAVTDTPNARVVAAQQRTPPLSRDQMVQMAQSRAFGAAQSQTSAFSTFQKNLVDTTAADVSIPPTNAVKPFNPDSRMHLDSVQKLSLLLVTTGLLAYSAVSPHTLPLTEYNTQFYENIRIASLVAIAPALYMGLIYDGHENDINSVINTFFCSFALGYALTFIVEVLATTVLRLAVFLWFEPDVFSLTPHVPIPVLPWVLRENQYRPKRITLFTADFLTSCVASPIIEECAKLMLLTWTVNLPKNFMWSTKPSSKRKKRRKVAESIIRKAGEEDTVSANQYVTHMLAASLGLKLCDVGRRVLLYTKPHHQNKSFYAVCRGIFPIQELCGTLTALALAKRNLLGVNTPLWGILAPAIVVHGMANFRGMKPIFKWHSATPWSEMQLFPWNFSESTTLPQMVKKGYPKLMWAIILMRVVGYCVKNYYMVNRHAVKRTTKYAGNHAAFSAELAVSGEMLRSQKTKMKYD